MTKSNKLEASVDQNQAGSWLRASALCLDVFVNHPSWLIDDKIQTINWLIPFSPLLFRKALHLRRTMTLMNKPIWTRMNTEHFVPLPPHIVGSIFPFSFCPHLFSALHALEILTIIPALCLSLPLSLICISVHNTSPHLPSGHLHTTNSYSTFCSSLPPQQ